MNNHDNLNDNFFDWLDFENEDELEWAANYLTKKGLVNFDEHADLTNEQVLYDVSGKINLSLSRSGLILLTKDMKAARNQRNNRAAKKKGNQKNYSFVMDVSIQAKLKKLADDRPISETLETIINDVDLFKKKIETELKASAKPPKPRSSGLTNEEANKRKIAQQEIIIKAQEKVLKELLIDVCKKERLIEKISEEPTLLAEDRAIASQKYKQRQQEINQQIREELNLIKFAMLNMNTNIFGDETVNEETQSELSS
jgi:hypothetical protein